MCVCFVRVSLESVFFCEWILMCAYFLCVHFLPVFCNFCCYIIPPPHNNLTHTWRGGAPTTQGTSWWCRNLIDFRPPNPSSQFKHCFAFVSPQKKSHDDGFKVNDKLDEWDYRGGFWGRKVFLIRHHVKKNLLIQILLYKRPICSLPYDYIFVWATISVVFL